MCLQDIKPSGPRLGGHVLARVPRRGRIWRPQQRHYMARFVVTTNARFVAILGNFACPAQQVWLPSNYLRIQPPGTPLLSASSNVCMRTSYSTTIAPISRQQHNKRRRQGRLAPPCAWRRRQRCCQRGRKPAASARRLPGQLQRQTRPPATQPPPRGIQTECQVCPPASSSFQDRQFTRPRPIPSQRHLTQ